MPQECVFQQAFHVTGALGANLAIAWTVPFDMQLIHVSAANSDADGVGVQIGTTSDADAYLATAAAGESLVPAEWDRDDFVGGEFPHIVKGTVMKITVDYDYNSGGGSAAGADFTIVLTYTEG
jgi:hypothetical protein